MKEGTLTAWVKEGYTHIKKEANLAPWVLPEHELNRLVDEVGDSGILHASGSLGLADGVARLLERGTDPAGASLEEWQMAVSNWPSISQVVPVVTAFLEAVVPAIEALHETKSTLTPQVVCRCLAVLLFAPFTGRGEKVLGEVAGILNGSEGDPAGLIRSFAAAVSGNDIRTVEKVDHCIVQYDSWRQWVSAMQKQVLVCQHIPKLIAVTPPPSADLASILVALIKEGYGEYTGDNAEYPGKPVIAR